MELYAKTADVEAKIAAVEAKIPAESTAPAAAGTNYTPVIVVLFVLSIAGVALGVVGFIKKK